MNSTKKQHFVRRFILCFKMGAVSIVGLIWFFGQCVIPTGDGNALEWMLQKLDEYKGEF